LFNFINAGKRSIAANMKTIITVILAVGVSFKNFAQTTTYPRLAGHVGIMHPIITFSKEGTTKNFRAFYTGGLPVGINIWKSARIGFSAEFVPFIRADSSGSKMNNFLFHPGILISLGNSWTFAGRAAFETAGRYGFTPVFNKIVKKNKSTGYYVSVPLPVRFGNGHSPSMGIGFQFGISF